VGTTSGLGASLSTAVSGELAGSFGQAAAFAGLAAVGLAGVLLLWLRMPETSLRAKDYLPEQHTHLEGR
jgi:hypothetical protein